MNAPSIDIIAELAQGYEGNPTQARLLILAAATAKADAAKFQIIYADELSTPDYVHYSLFKSLEMADEVWIELAAYGKEQGVRLIFDVFGERSLALAEQLGDVDIMVHATDIGNEQLLKRIAQGPTERVLLGAGGAGISEIEAAVAQLKNKKVAVMIGYQGYPTPEEDNQIARIAAVVARLSSLPNVSVGFADHSLPDNPRVVALSAMALGCGARLFEKHLTLGEVMKLEDHESAINPDRFAQYSADLRRCAEAFGSVTDADDFGMSHAEATYRRNVRRSVVTARAVPAGTRLSEADLVLKRTANEEALRDLSDVLGRTVKRDFESNQPLEASDVE